MRLNTLPTLIRRTLAAFGLAALVAGAAAAPAGAQSIDDILNKKKLQVGVLVDLPPFGVTNTENKPEGYDIDVAALMAKYLGVELELVSVTGPNRIPYLLTNKVDVLIATFGITAERSKQVLFSNPYSSLTIYVLAPKALNIKTPEDLKPVSISVA